MTDFWTSAASIKSLFWSNNDDPNNLKRPAPVSSGYEALDVLEPTPLGYPQTSYSQQQPPAKRACITPAPLQSNTIAATMIPNASLSNPMMPMAAASIQQMAAVVPVQQQQQQLPTRLPIAPARKGQPKQAPKPKHKNSDARRHKNREHAKNSREKKKQELETLQGELDELQAENEALRNLVKTKLQDQAAAIIGHDCYRTTSLPSYLTANNQQSSNPVLHKSDFELLESLTQEQQSFVLTDPRLPDNPIVYASHAFCQLTGYKRDQVIGRNCRFLQGNGTEEQAVEKIRQAIASGKDATVRILNFKADGTPFWNQFFLAALHDKHNKIVNYVGVQCLDDTQDDHDMDQDDEGDDQKQPATSHPPPSALQLTQQHLQRQQEQFQQPVLQSQPEQRLSLPPVGGAAGTLSAGLSLHKEEGGDMIDWAELAHVMEADFHGSDLDESFWDDDLSEVSTNANTNDDSDDGELHLTWEENVEESEVAKPKAVPLPTASSSRATALDKKKAPLIPESPRLIVLETIKGELIHALLDSQGDVTEQRFIKSLDIISKMYVDQQQSNASLSPLLHGDWRSLSRPSYSGCLGQNENQEFVYTLGQMCFNMFKPGNVRCTVQRTVNTITPVCEMNQAPRSAPFGLRRELALVGPDASQAGQQIMLKSYDISVALTVEPSDFGATPSEDVPSPPCRLSALKVVNGYFLPDPDTWNRLTVFFTGGKLSPVPSEDDDFGGLEEWKRLFGGNHKRSWGESLSVMGAKVFLGAELPKGMDQNGAMSYTLHRPHGGHGKCYVDILYLDDDLFVTKGNHGTIHVMSKNLGH